MTLTELKKQRQSKVDQILKDCEVFFAFSEKQFDGGKEKVNASPSNKVTSIGGGGFVPVKNLQKLTQSLEDLEVWYKKQEKLLDDKIRLKKISADYYDEMLCVLPPIYHPNGVFQVSEAYDHVMLNGKEQARYDTFVKRGKNHYSAGILTKAQARAFAQGGSING